MHTFLVPVGISNRHLHLSEEHISQLFGENSTLTKKKDLSQPGQFAAEETVTLIGPKGKLEGVRVLGPARDETQIELAVTDAIKLGLNISARDSGNTKGTPGIDIIAGDKKVSLEHGVIAAMRHIHASEDDALQYGIKDKDMVKVLFEGPRGGILHNVLVRVKSTYALDLHIDTDEANALGLKNGDTGTVIVED
ncbi:MULTISPECIES: phosphate propanoyltransferase [unclassified Dehalobacter]|uniref:phosphate propanoyltransferase n=1 Tax=unclassified Dehalobacter TaxID=2635733 RepID=UPI00036809DF|nr:MULTISPECIES: phosphate propanoyltransferase [unclassified Dehalobacter]RJE49053.1 propanediol utilization protein [Dehalobacter sp. MCB1]TCX51793.1 phosphate propanoyltransferase [Dehalobacter sp. 14DCB1]TCX52853.1 phosphate propanoyltransferase [Dehalobacter sp. 12DCB1]